MNTGFDIGVAPKGGSSSDLFATWFSAICRRREVRHRRHLRSYPKTVGDWLILRSLRSKMCLSPSLQTVFG